MPPVSRPLVDRAPAKVNLTLHVLGRRADGYHALESLVAFAGAGDHLTFTPGPELAIDVTGSRAGQAGPAEDNLVLKAARHLAERRPSLRLGHFALVKRLPAAAGLGGGSSDAAAALRLLARANGFSLDDLALREAARATGADVPVCLDPRARVMTGAGERLGGPLRLPPLPAVLVNPAVPVATADVFEALGLRPGEIRVSAGNEAEWPSEAAQLVDALARARNDLEPAALSLAPVIGTALNALQRTPGCRLARMSGSGATVLGLFGTGREALAAARRVRAEHRDWWVRATILR
ncbi:MAG TPA: 4-(cytidine 5'-diphospho)-2-C-methyl-D-erythritol kinase [Beijerinckiaceae bacterium]